MNPHVKRRLAVAERFCVALRENSKVSVVCAAGSVGAGLADRWSDLEIDCYWAQPPTDAERRAAIDRAGGVVEAFWDYDAEDREWSEDFRVDELSVTVSNFTVATVDDFLTAVTQNADPDPIKHLRLAAIQRCRPLLGGNLVDNWRARASAYPDRLADTLIERTLQAGILAGWSARDALVERSDMIAVRALLSRIEQAIMAALYPINRVYRPHRVEKWQRAHLAELRLAPADLGARLDAMWSMPPDRALAQAGGLLAETVELAARRSTADLTDIREMLAERRRPD